MSNRRREKREKKGEGRWGREGKGREMGVKEA